MFLRKIEDGYETICKSSIRKPHDEKLYLDPDASVSKVIKEEKIANGITQEEAVHRQLELLVNHSENANHMELARLTEAMATLIEKWNRY